MQTSKVATVGHTPGSAKIAVAEVPSVAGVVGLSAPGDAYAHILNRAGFRVIAHDPDLNRTETLLEAGCEVASGLRGLSVCDTVITCLPDDALLAPMVLGEGGLVQSMPAGSLHIALGTISLELSRRFKAAHEIAGQHYVMALTFRDPECGHVSDALILATGSEVDVARALPLLKHCGNLIFAIDGAALEAAGGMVALRPGE